MSTISPGVHKHKAQHCQIPGKGHMTRWLPGVRLVLLSELPLIIHMVRAASLSAGSSDSVREGGREGNKSMPSLTVLWYTEQE